MRLLSTRLATAAVLLVLAVSLAPVAAQSPEKVPRVGFLGPRTRSNDARFLDAFLQGLRDLGWVEGKTIVIEYRWAEGKSDRLPDLAAELVRLKVDVILAGSAAVAVAVKNATESRSAHRATRQFELVINLKTAELLGLTIPPSLLLRADQVIE